MKTNLYNIVPFPSAGWCLNGHIHTIACSLLGDTKQPSVKRIKIATPDNDFLELDCATTGNSESVVVLFHGLEGSSKRYYIVSLMKELLEENYSVVAVNFRSCGSQLNDRPRFYHSGETEDYHTVFSWVKETYPDQRIAAVRFSLGGNALVKSLAEEGSDHPADTAVAVSVPYDLRLGSLMLSKGFRRVYEYRFLRTLRDKLERKQQQFSNLPTFSGSTIYEFDDQITAPLHGFEDADDYYKQCSARQFVDDINIPALLIHSREDPLCPIQAMPVDKAIANPNTDFIITNRGGHVGFRSSPKGWLNYAIRTYLKKQMPAI